MNHFRRAGLSALTLALSGALSASDWPTYMRDATRVGWTPDPLRAPLAPRWTSASPQPPQRSWPEPDSKILEGKEVRNRVSFDEAFHVAVAGGRVFFGSSVENRVFCLDADSGRELWSFFTDGPVRLAPTAWNGRLYFGSDDGFAYCLDASTGRLQWRLRAGPRDERILARGRMTSRWAVRTGVLVDAGVAYFGAGTFPHENVYLLAVDALTGAVIWKNDAISERDAGRSDLTPQGYLLASRDTLFVPSGRSLPVAVKRATGEFLYQAQAQWRTTAGGQIGGSQAFLADDQLYAVGEHHVLALDEEKGKVGFGWFQGRQMTLAGDRAYLANGREILAVDRARYAEGSRARHDLEMKLWTLGRELALHPSRDLQRRIKDEEEELKREPEPAEREKREKALAGLRAKLEASMKEYDAKKKAHDALKPRLAEAVETGVHWRVPSTLDAALILAGDTLVAGGKDEVAAFDAATGRRVWSERIEGDARGLAASGGYLLVSTSRGRIHCFGDATHRPPPLALPAARPAAEPFPPDDLTPLYARAADAIVERSGVRQGYCLVLGSERGRLAFELARRTELQIYAVESDPVKIQDSRERLAAAGLYGTRITIDPADLSILPYPRYFADLIVSDTLLLTGKVPGDPAQAARHLKPLGGVFCLGAPDAPDRTRKEVADWLGATKLSDEGAQASSSGPWTLLRRGALPGADAWTHQYGNPANTSSNRDARLRGGLSVLWYGDPGPGKMLNRHAGAVGPVSANGRLFVQGDESIMAVDAYNGRILWERKNPDALRTGVFNNLEPGNLAAAGDLLYTVVKGQCLEIDGATGRSLRTFGIPEADETREWSYLAVEAGLLFGTSTLRRTLADRERRRGHDKGGATDRIFAIDLSSGRPLWSFQGRSISHTTIAVGEGRVFFIDSSITADEREALLRVDKAALQDLKGPERGRAEERMKRLDVRLAVGLDARTGRRLWAEPVDVTDCSDVGIGGGRLTMMYQNNHLVLCGANANGHYWTQFLAGAFKVRRLVVLSATSGQTIWSKDANYRIRPLVVGREIIAEPWAFDLYTGKPRTRTNPLTGEDEPWKFGRPGHHCGPIAASPALMFFRSGTTAYYDLEADSGTRHFAGHRLGCWINAVPANGLLLVPEASAGCVCLFSIAATVAFEPREDRQLWGIYCGEPKYTPVRHMALNLGAPGDRRDASGRLWLAFPRPTSREGLEFKPEAAVAFAPGGAFFSRNAESVRVAGAEPDWVFASGARGLTRFSLRLIGPGEPKSSYTVRLLFTPEPGERPGQRVFEVRLQGKTAAAALDVAARAEGPVRAVVASFAGVEVSDHLVLEFVPSEKRPAEPHLPVLCGIEVLRSGDSPITK